MKKLTRTLMTAVSTMAVAGATMAAELPVEDFPGGIDNGPTAPGATLSADSAGRNLPVEEYPGGGGSGDPTDPSLEWSAKSEGGLRNIIQNFLSRFGR